jgi:hypothetical protein
MSAQATQQSSQTNVNGTYQEESQDLVEDQIQPLSGTGEAGLAALNGWSYRHDWGNRRGQHVLNLNSNLFRAGQVIMVAIGEGAAGGPPAGKFVGASRYTLHNVAPQNGRVSIWINIEWSSNIRIYVDYLVVG